MVGIAMCLRRQFLGLVIAVLFAARVPAAENVPKPDSKSTQQQAAAPPALQTRLVSVPIEGKFDNGWRQTVKLPATSSGAEERVQLAVDEGWLSARRESADGQFDWQIVLCRVQDAKLPDI